jgi:hypothetical protein
LTVCHELSSGAALVPEIGAMYGPRAVSETALIAQNLRRLPPESIVMADAGFGIFQVAHEAHSAGHSFVLRLTRQRFCAMQNSATLVEQAEGSRTWALDWRPSRKDRQTRPDLPRDAVLSVRLSEVVVNDQLTLWLASDLPDSAAALGALYERRTHVETDLSNLKIVLKTELIRARSDDTFRKELLAAIVSYNLVTQFRRQSAALINEPPRRLSFKRTWTTFNVFLLSKRFPTPVAWIARYREALSYAATHKLPHRPGRRSPREAYPRRPKSNSFQKRLPKPIAPD